MQLLYVCIISSCVFREIIAQHNTEAQLGLLAHEHGGYFLTVSLTECEACRVPQLHFDICTTAAAHQQPASNCSAETPRTGDTYLYRKQQCTHVKSLYWFWCAVMQPHILQCVSFSFSMHFARINTGKVGCYVQRRKIHGKAINTQSSFFVLRT